MDAAREAISSSPLRHHDRAGRRGRRVALTPCWSSSALLLGEVPEQNHVTNSPGFDQTHSSVLGIANQVEGLLWNRSTVTATGKPDGQPGSGLTDEQRQALVTLLADMLPPNQQQTG
jgi:hypothetical protein